MLTYRPRKRGFSGQPKRDTGGSCHQYSFFLSTFTRMLPFDREVHSIWSKSSSLEGSADRLLSTLSLSEKLSLLDGDLTPIGFFTSVAKHGYCGVPVSAAAVQRVGLPGILFSDGPRGINEGTAFPTPSARAASFDPALEEEIVSWRGARHANGVGHRNGKGVQGTRCKLLWRCLHQSCTRSSMGPGTGVLWRRSALDRQHGIGLVTRSLSECHLMYQAFRPELDGGPSL